MAWGFFSLYDSDFDGVFSGFERYGFEARFVRVCFRGVDGGRGVDFFAGDVVEVRINELEVVHADVGFAAGYVVEGQVEFVFSVFRDVQIAVVDGYGAGRKFGGSWIDRCRKCLCRSIQFAKGTTVRYPRAGSFELYALQALFRLFGLRRSCRNEGFVVRALGEGASVFMRVVVGAADLKDAVLHPLLHGGSCLGAGKVVAFAGVFVNVVDFKRSVFIGDVEPYAFVVVFAVFAVVDDLFLLAYAVAAVFLEVFVVRRFGGLPVFGVDDTGVGFPLPVRTGTRLTPSQRAGLGTPARSAKVAIQSWNWLGWVEMPF